MSSSLICPLCMQLMNLPVTLICCGLTTCEQCCLSRTGDLCTCGVMFVGREGFLYNEDVRMEIEKFHLDKNTMTCPEYSEGFDEKAIIKAPDSMLAIDTSSASEEKYSDHYKSNKKRKKIFDEEENKEDKRFRGELVGKKNVSCHILSGLGLEEKKVKYSDRNEPFDSTCIQTDDTQKTLNKKEIGKSWQSTNKVENYNKLCSDSDNDRIIVDADEYSEKKKFNLDPEANLIDENVVTVKKLENVLVFLDLLKFGHTIESPFSQIGCFFDEKSFRSEISETTDQIQRFYAVAAPKLEDFSKNPELWAKYILFDEFYYKQYQQTIRCISEKTALENLCQYLAKIKLKYREVNICVLTRRQIKDLMKRINTYNMGNIFFSNVDGFILLKDALTKDLDLSLVPEHSDVRSETLYHISFDHLCKNYFDIHPFPRFKGLKNKSFEVEEVKSKSLYIGDLSIKVTDKDLERKITKVARPSSVRVCLHPKTRISLGYAYANFDSEEKAEKVLRELQASPLMNKPMRIMYYNKKVVDKNNHLWRSNVFVKNLDPDVNNKRLEAAFSAYGQILSCKVSTDERGKSKCFGFVQFKSESSAWKAINDLDGLRINYKELYVCIKKSVKDRIEEEKKRLVNGSHYTVLEIRNLDPGTTHESFLTLLGKASANITRFHLEKRENEGTIGFVTFESSRFASEAQNTLDKMELGGFKLIVMQHKKQKLISWKLQELKEKERIMEGVERDKEIFIKYGKDGFKGTDSVKDLREKLLKKN